MNNVTISSTRELFQKGKWVECIESCLRIISHNYDNIEIWGLCALSYANINRLDEAIECLHEALKVDKKQGGANIFNLSVNLAELYRRNNMVLQAISLLRTFLPKNDENLHFNLAKCYADLQDYEKSIQHYTTAITINPKDIHAIFNLANQEAALGRFNLALKYYTLAYEGGLGDAGLNLAQLYVSLDNMESALKLYKDLEIYYSQDSNFYFNYANALRFNFQNEASIEKYYRALNLQFDARYAINFAYLLLSMGDIENGFLLYEQRKNLLQDSKNKYNSVVLNKHFLDFGFESKEALFSFLRGKRVVLYHEQGFGDSIMFARFIPFLLEKVMDSALTSKGGSGGNLKKGQKNIESSKFSTKDSIKTTLESKQDSIKNPESNGEVFLFLPKELESLFTCFNLKIFTSYSFKTNDYDIAIPLPSLAYLFATNTNILQSLHTIRPLLLDSINSNDSLPHPLRRGARGVGHVSVGHVEPQGETSNLQNMQQKSQKVTESSIPIKKILKTYEIDSKDTDNKIIHTKHKNQAHKLDIAIKKLDSKSKSSKFHNLDSIFANEKNIKVGLNFMSNPKFQNAREKSIYPQKLLESLPRQGFKYYSLQYEGIDKELASEFNVTDLREYIRDFADTARLLTHLDFVISIDSALAHLSASLGLKTAILLHKRHDWRWGKLGNFTESNLDSKLNFKIDSKTSKNHNNLDKKIPTKDSKHSIESNLDSNNSIESIAIKTAIENANDCLWYDNIYLFKQENMQEWTHVFKSLHTFLLNLYLQS
ncbi:tetratricopeptide repeat protein [Helicobacter saguini]|uniref:Tetratricopeptide repeat protein n=1 Tax=Helicobacter saguini TaxID=1548018 RepID=A0A347VPW2_9HELI|nr:tetratricopeptide repeat-containing glycosyltransferase family protein [Helicobacter saguini]MWV61187.1 tetratricopeptide repeat protein [Helicobacter saguini]MWV68146.1 tetratricopeptide repeat protein [Helicobacter saguini]MWV70391.1 tetratricopeptide repeat protein [Helicobacter saguini]MWV72292.1 tetratricopeptide repeat protein [Helicobacter saguini]TLD95331.1 tetratricopeptide repeat protein [Helicobacter saguini]